MALAAHARVPEPTPAAPPARPGPQEDRLLRVTGLTKRFGQLAAVDDVHLEVRKGEFLTLLGPSGSGKTTLLMMLAGFVAPSAGRIELHGRDVAPLPPEKRHFGMVFQGYALFPHLSVADNVGFPLSVRRVPAAERRTRVLEALRTVHMEAFAGRMPKQLSGGQQQRVALARAIVFAPELLLLDEPLGALDRQLRVTLQDELKSLHRTLGTTFICVTHDQDEAMSMSDRVVVMRQGRIVQVGVPAEIYERPRTRFVAGFLGESNVLSGRIIERRGGTAVVELGGQRLEVATGGQPGAALFSVRPERFRLSATRPASGFALEGRIADATFMGADRRLRIETAQLGTLIVKLRGGPSPPPRGTETWVSFEPGALWPVEDDGD